MTHLACESKIRSVVRSSMHPYPGDLVVAIGRAVVYYAQASQVFSAGIECQHSKVLLSMFTQKAMVHPSRDISQIVKFFLGQNEKVTCDTSTGLKSALLQDYSHKNRRINQIDTV